MAKRTKNVPVNGADADLPEGFVSVVAERSRAFVKPTEGLSVRGVMLGRFPRRDDSGNFFYQLQLTAPIADGGVKVPDPTDDKKWIDGSAEIGALVSVDERTEMTGWKLYADRPGEVEVYVRFINKEPIQGGKTMWRVVCGVREIPKAELARMAKDAAASAE